MPLLLGQARERTLDRSIVEMVQRNLLRSSIPCCQKRQIIDVCGSWTPPSPAIAQEVERNRDQQCVHGISAIVVAVDRANSAEKHFLCQILRFDPILNRPIDEVVDRTPFSPADRFDLRSPPWLGLSGCIAVVHRHHLIQGDADQERRRSGFVTGASHTCVFAHVSWHARLRVAREAGGQHHMYSGGPTHSETAPHGGREYGDDSN